MIASAGPTSPDGVSSLSHEASANAANLEWNGEPVNHQWGKSWAAETLLDHYVREHVLANVHYFSVLAPVHDEVIFELLAQDAALELVKTMARTVR